MLSWWRKELVISSTFPVRRETCEEAHEGRPAKKIGLAKLVFDLAQRNIVPEVVAKRCWRYVAALRVIPIFGVSTIPVWLCDHSDIFGVVSNLMDFIFVITIVAEYLLHRLSCGVSSASNAFLVDTLYLRLAYQDGAQHYGRDVASSLLMIQSQSFPDVCSHTSGFQCVRCFLFAFCRQEFSTITRRAHLSLARYTLNTPLRPCKYCSEYTLYWHIVNPEAVWSMPRGRFAMVVSRTVLFWS